MKENGRSFWRVFLVLGLVQSMANGMAASSLRVERRGTEVMLIWTGGVLQTAPNISGTWQPVPGASSPHPVNPLSRAFYRVQETYNVTVAKGGAGAGMVRAAPGIDCGADCAEVWLSGEIVRLQALPEAGSTFTGWTGDCTGTGDCELKVNSPKSVTATFARAAVQQNSVVNSGFEDGALVGWQQQPGQLIYSSAELGVPAHSGQYMARLGFEPDNRRLARIGQQITLPTSRPLFLNFALWLYSEELCDVPYYDGLALYVAGQTVVSEDRVCRGSDTGGWRRYSVDLTAVAGQTVPIVFEISSADNLASIMLLDDIAVSNQSWQ